MSVENINNSKYNIKYLIPVFVMTTLILGACSSAKQDTEPVKKPAEMQQVKVAPQKAGKPTKELMRTVKKPTNPTKLLQNIKYAIDNELLIREDFYTDDNLKKLYGGERVVWKKNEPVYKLVRVVELGGIFERAKKLQNIGVGIGWQKLDSKGVVSDSGQIHGRISILNPEDPHFNVDEVIGVFGAKMQIVNPYEKNTQPVPLLATTHKLGNKELTYTMDGLTSKTIITFLIDGDGKINHSKFIQEEK